MTAKACTQNPHIYSVLKPRKSRTKSGCLPCRTRRKKCDEHRPLCRSCDRLHLTCSWPDLPSDELSIITPTSKREPQLAQPWQQHALTDPTDKSRTNSSFSPCGDDHELPGPLKEAFVAELHDLGQQLRDCGILPYDANGAPAIRHQISEVEGPEAAMLFDHFCRMTAPWLINGDSYENPVLRHILPLIIKDDLVLNTVLALSGTHLRNSMPSIASVAMKYYSYALHTLKQRLSDWLSSSNKDYKPLFATTVLLCHCEFIQGNANGAALQHLRACREFVGVALEHLHQSDHQDFVVFLVEHYGYFVLTTNLRSSLQENNIRLGLEFSTSIMPLIKTFSSFGSIFAFEPGAIALIPQIAQLAWQRRHSSAASDDRLCRATYLSLLDSLQDGTESADPRLWNKREIVISFKINALLMFLHASFYEYGTNPSWITELLHPIIDRTMILLPHVEETEACYGLFWSVLILGSYIRDPIKQELLVRHLESNQSDMSLLKRGADLLQWLWNEPEDVNFGLTGLEKIATAQGVDMCIC